MCREGQNEELKYSIRSILHFFPDAEVWVVGGKPGWYTGNYIKVGQGSGKMRNVMNNIQAVLNNSGINESFIYMNDDFYLIDRLISFDYFYEGTLSEKYNSYAEYNGRSTYAKQIFDTNHRLKRLGYRQPLSYELHVPFPVEKSKLAKIVQYDKLLWRSIYGNMFSVGGSFMEDVKVYTNPMMKFKDYDYKNPTSPFLSSDDTSFEMLRNDLLSHMFRDKSKYEK